MSMFRSNATKLFDAMSAHDFEAFQKAARGYFDPNATNKEGQTLVHAWVEEGYRTDERFLDVLLKAGADINLPNTEGKTPLDHAMHAWSGAMVGQRDSHVMEKEYEPRPDKVRMLYARNAKPAQEELPAIRQVMLGVRGGKHWYDETISRISEGLEGNRKESKRVPDINAPAFENNRDDPYLAFAETVNRVHIIASAVTDKVHSPAFYELMKSIREPSWEDFAKTIPADPREGGQGIHDMMRDVSRNLIVPALMRGLDEKSRGKMEESRLHYMTNLTHYDDFVEGMVKGKRVEQLIGLGDSYHRHVTELHDKLNLRITDLQWETLSTAGKEFRPELRGLKGWSIVNLTNGKELMDEGHKMDHCVGGYASYCEAAKTHIFSVRDPQGNSVSTFELQPKENSHDKQEFRLVQHMAKSNTPVSRDSKRMYDWFEKAMGTRAMPLRKEYELGANNRDEVDSMNPLERMSYHRQEDMTADRQQEIFDILMGNHPDVPRLRDGRNTYLVQPHQRKMRVEDFLEETGINKSLVAQCKEQSWSQPKLKYTAPKAPEIAEAKPTEPSWQERVALNQQSGRAPQNERGRS